ncbi:hypothetical protein BX600DRAFT_418986 [Xylariales sp. PMI_506]|nr:hypothetical protein BX600DRAFT_418986 [Xylariales sp. PMI_506]
MVLSRSSARGDSGENTRDSHDLSLSSLSLTRSTNRTHSKTSSNLLARILTSRTTTKDSKIFDCHGRIGLSTIYSPSDPLIEYVFVHGLGGGSTKTWSLERDSSSFWPQEWLPHHSAFRNVRIHSFGYNSNWAEKGTSTLDIRDFGQALILAMRNSECFSTNPIVFVSHSMGGIVAKEAYLMACEDPACQSISERISAMVFLATPHRGSDYSIILNNLLRLSAVHNPKQYVADLNRCSAALVRINDSFRHHSDKLILYSYFEVNELNIGPAGSILVVPKDSAIMGLPGERVSMVDADHRGICKFTSPDDSKYTALTDAFATINAEISLSLKNSETAWELLRQIEEYLGISDTPEDDLKDLDDIRLEGSCDWLIERSDFQTWITIPPESGSKIYWIHAGPAVGKSVLASHVIDVVSAFNNDCSYYFFRHGDKNRSTLAGCLRSLVFQMAILNQLVRNKLQVMIERGVRFEKDNAKHIWRKVLEPLISSAVNIQPQFWIIDALDECSDIATFFSIFTKLDISIPIKVLVTSRKTEEIAAGFANLEKTSRGSLISTEIQLHDIRGPIFMYLTANKDQLHVGTEQQREILLNKILDKSQGCFLWVRLVLEELSGVWTMQQIEQVLTDVPQEMDPLYSRALTMIGKRPLKSVAIASAILTWTVCAIRPMTVGELKAALKLDIGADIENPEQAIPSLCAQLVHVDKSGRVLMVHLTAKTFLRQHGLDSPLAICPILGHKRIACVCLKYLNSDEMKPPTGRRAAGRKRSSQQASAFLTYSSFNFAEHMRRTTSNNQEIGPLLYELLQKNVFSWIEVIARANSLCILPQTADVIKNYYQRQKKYFPPLGEQLRLGEDWTIDLHRLVAKFGSNLVRQPTSIHSLVPPFCPRSSAVAEVFGSPAKRIKVTGLEDTGWDDRLACIDSQDTQAYAVASGEGYFAVGYGCSIVLCHIVTCQKWKTLDHESTVRLLSFDYTGNILVSAGRRDIKVWELESDILRHHFRFSFDILSFSLTKEEKGLYVALKNNSTGRWSLYNGEKISDVQWGSTFEDESQFRRPPLLATFSPDESTLAVAYRGRPVLIWDLENDEPYGFVGRENRNLETIALGTNTSPSSFVFNAEESVTLLAVAYEDGDLCLFEYEELRLLKSIEANAQILACSPNGALLATGNAVGMVQLLEFETLQLLFRVNASDYGIRCLDFNSENTRFFDVRGTQCNVWEPALPSGLSQKEDASSNWENQEPRIVGLADGEVEITAMTIEESGSWFFIGKSDGSVWLYQTADGKPNKFLYRHGFQMSVTRMIWGSKRNLLVTADVAGRFIVCSLQRNDNNEFQDPVRILDIKGDVHNKTAISQILLKDDNKLLLVSDTKSDKLWNINESKIVSSHRFSSRPSFHWVNHPTNSTERILVSTKDVEIWDWETCRRKSTAQELKLEPSLVTPQFHGIKCATQTFNTRILVEYSDHHGEGSSTTSVLLLDPQQLSNHHAVISSKALATVCSDLLHLIGTIDSKIVFLDKQLCICSVEMLEGTRTSFRYAVHCFIPADWFSQRGVLRTSLTKNGDILFVRAQEVAVIKSGMLFEDFKKIVEEEE